eukprot:5634871-Lingulodinium_polyedra.AAC.1
MHTCAVCSMQTRIHAYALAYQGMPIHTTCAHLRAIAHHCAHLQTTAQDCMSLHTLAPITSHHNTSHRICYVRKGMRERRPPPFTAAS